MHHKNLFMPLALISAMASAQQVYAANDFVVRDIKIDGLVRLLPANVYGLIPVSSGDRASDAVIADSIRALYASGLFDDIKASNENDVLVYRVVERPIISKVEFKGNKLIPKEALQEGLKKMGVQRAKFLKNLQFKRLNQNLHSNTCSKVAMKQLLK